jgi:hypothetical protein
MEERRLSFDANKNEHKLGLWPITPPLFYFAFFVFFFLVSGQTKGRKSRRTTASFLLSLFYFWIKALGRMNGKMEME